ncbi:MAG: SLC13 family permease, partial [Solirubrobacteraceae bacterium]|nr:SLC13 family permease [Solirubrobacteraceae bacterium]
MTDAAITFAVLGGAVLLFLWNQLPVAVVALGASLALYVFGVVDVGEAFAGFGDPTVIFIASLFVISEALDSTGVTTWATHKLVALAGDSESRLVVLLLILAAVLATILTPNGAVAALVPMTVLLAFRLGQSPSKLLIPMAFSSYAGALVFLTGSPVNVLVADEAGRVGEGAFSYFEFAFVGVPLTIGVIGIALLLGPRLLPERSPRSLSVDLSGHARTLMAEYRLKASELAEHEVPAELFTRATGVAEVVIPPRSPLIGQEMFPGMVTDSGDLLVLAVRRGDTNAGPRGMELDAGDVLLLEGSWAALDEHLTDDEVLVVDDPDAVRRRVVPLGNGAKTTIVILVAMVAALATGFAPAAVAGAVAAMALVVTGVLEIERVYRAISWTTVILIAGLIPVSTALQTTGAAADLADALLRAMGDAGPHALLAALFGVAAVLSVAVSNTATALILIPVGVAAAQSLEVSAQPVLMSVAVASSASFLTPISTPGNLMIMDPAGYRFGDYWKLGVPMMLLFFVVAVFLV